jgi:peptidoglycan-associated lipoprotein
MLPMRLRRTTTAAVAALLALAGAACTKKVAATKPPAPPAAAPVVANTSTPQPTPAREVPRSTPTASTPTSRYPDAATRARIDQLLARISDAYFDYNKAALRADALKTLQSDAVELRNILAQYPVYKLQVEGYCDERGSAEYNLALGDRRAEAAKEYLVGVGIPSAQLTTVSYGKEHPICAEHDEACWQRNRRIHIVAMAR